MTIILVVCILYKHVHLRTKPYTLYPHLTFPRRGGRTRSSNGMCPGLTEFKHFAFPPDMYGYPIHSYSTSKYTHYTYDYSYVIPN